MKNFTPLIIGATILSFTLSQSAFSLDKFESLQLRADNRFEIGNGDVLPVAKTNTEEPYRVCVRDGWHMAPLKVIHDGKQSTVNKGSCANFEAKSISIAPAKKMAKNEVLSGQFRHIHE